MFRRMSVICKVTKFYKRCQREKTFCSIDGKYRAGASLHDSIASLSRNSIHLMREPSLLRDVFQQTNTFLHLYCCLYQSVYSAAHFTLIISHFSGLVITIIGGGGGQAEECATNSREAKKVSELGSGI